MQKTSSDFISTSSFAKTSALKSWMNKATIVFAIAFIVNSLVIGRYVIKSSGKYTKMIEGIQENTLDQSKKNILNVPIS